jgi:dCTP deaminase
MEAMKRGDITISNFDPGRLKPNSYDLKLGRHFFEVIWDEDGPWFIGPKTLAVGERIHVPVGGTLLGMTEDVIGTFGRVIPKLRACSSEGRICFSICMDAGSGDIGYKNHWTLELRAFTLIGRPFVTVGQRIGQMLFDEAKSEPIESYQGRYNVDDWPMCMVPPEWQHRIVGNFLDTGVSLFEGSAGYQIVDTFKNG